MKPLDHEVDVKAVQPVQNLRRNNSVGYFHVELLKNLLFMERKGLQLRLPFLLEFALDEVKKLSQFIAVGLRLEVLHD